MKSFDKAIEPNSPVFGSMATKKRPLLRPLKCSKVTFLSLKNTPLNTHLTENTTAINTEIANRTTPYYANVYYNGNGDTSFSAGIIKFNTIVKQKGNNYSTSTGLFTCPVNGLYYVGFVVFSNAHSTSSYQRVSIMKNNDLVIQTDIVPFNISTIVPCNKGDTLYLMSYSTQAISFFAAYGHNVATFALIQRF